MMSAEKLPPLYIATEQAPVKEIQEKVNKGFICLNRGIKKHWLWKASHKKTKLEAWIDLLLMANHDAHKEPFGNDLIVLKRGQLLTSQERLAKEWFWDRSAVRGFLKQLESDRMISAKVTTKFTVITICNYASYNDLRPAKQHQSNIKATSTQHIQPLEPLEQVSSTPPKQVWLYSHNGFFDRQLKANEGQTELGKYQKLVEFLHEQDEDGKPKFGNVLSLPKQISFKDYVKLKEIEKEYGHRSLKEVLESMENKRDLKKEYQNVFLTANNWLKNEFKK